MNSYGEERAPGTVGALAWVRTTVKRVTITLEAVAQGETEMTLLRTLIFTVVVPCTVVVYGPWWLLSTGRAQPSVDLGAIRYLGLIPIAIGAAMYLWCAWDFAITGRGTPAPIDPPKTLVVRGLYRYTRNPIYVGVTLALCGEALLFESGVLLAYAIMVFIAFNLFVIFYEEPSLRERFGDAYERYYQAVPRWLPRWFQGQDQERS